MFPAFIISDQSEPREEKINYYIIAFNVSFWFPILCLWLYIFIKYLILCF